MRTILPLWAQPLNIFQIYGTMCCPQMRISFLSKHLVENFMCYDARSIYDANVLVLWGSFSRKLSSLVLAELDAMPDNRALIHIRGCQSRIDNEISKSSLLNVLPINNVYSSCSLNPDEVSALIREVRQCLRA